MTDGAAKTTHGRCLCGAVEFEVRGPLRPIIYCHCDTCRRSSGHYVAATACALKDLHFGRREGLRWYSASAIARRGFCMLCGSQLFWEPAAGTHMSIMAGALDKPTGLVAHEHIFVSEAGDYYEILDGLPQKEGETA